MCHSVLYVPVLYEETVQSRRLDLYGTFVPLEDYSCSTWPRLLLKAATVLQPQPDFRYQRKGEISLSSAMFTFDSKQLSVPGSRPSCVTHSRHLLAELLVLPV